MSEFISNAIELMKTHSVAVFINDYASRKNDPAGIIADLWHYCDAYKIDFFDVIAEGEFGPQKGTYEDNLANIIADLIYWCEQNDYDWDYELEKAQFLVDVDTNGCLYKVMQI